MNRNQSGSAHLIIIVVLSIALIGTLGFMFWQNILQPKDAVVTGASNTADQTKAATVNLKKYCAPVEKVCFDYPEDWKIEQPAMKKTVSNGQTVGDDFFVKDSTNSVVLRFESALGPMDICCGPMPEGPVTVLAATKVSTFGTLATNAYAKDRADGVYMSEIVTSKVEMSFSNPSDPSTQKDTIVGYRPLLLLHNASTLTKPLTFQNVHGGVGLDNLMQGKNGSFSFGSAFVDANNKELKMYKTSDEAKSVLSNEAYKQAKAILLSAKYED